MNNADNPLPSGSSMIRIDGGKVRKFREEKGLTQLYVATVVGVTTDTISRWENRRYQTIKSENAVKLAAALVVPLETILDANGRRSAAADTAPSRQQGAETGRRGKRVGLVLAGLMAATLTVITVSWWKAAPVPGDILAFRVLPAHVAPGQPFPVAIRVEAKEAREFSFIVSESLPAQCVALQGSPDFTTANPKTNTVKWLGKSASGTATFFYLARTNLGTEEGDTLHFRGEITLRRTSGAALAIDGDADLLVSHFHWADKNRDSKIDDEEILTVYDTLNAAEHLNFDRKLIEDIWSAAGYRWDQAAGRFVIIP